MEVPPQQPAAAGGYAARKAAAQRELAFTKRLALIATFFHAATQVTYLKGVQPLSYVWCQRVGSVLFVALTWAFPTVAPISALRWRRPFLIVMRVLFFAFPLLRSNVGIQRVLNVTPTPGRLGFAVDLFKVAWGCRLFAVMFAAVIVPLPQLLHLVLTSYGTLVVRSNGSLCSMPLLSHRITVGRVASFHQWAALLSVTGGTGFSLSPALLPATQQRQCEALLNFVFIIWGVVMPTAIIVLTEVTKATQNWFDTSVPIEHRSAYRVAVEYTEVAVRRWCGGSSSFIRGRSAGSGADAPSVLRLAMVWWLLLSLIWLLSVSAA